MSDQVALENEKRAGADRDLAIKKAEYKAEVNQAEATAEVAFDIEKAKQGQTVSALPAKGRRLLCFFEKSILGSCCPTNREENVKVGLPRFPQQPQLYRASRVSRPRKDRNPPALSQQRFRFTPALCCSRNV